MNYLTDTHCHLYLPDFSGDLDAVLQEANRHQVHKILVPGISAETNHLALELSRRYGHCIHAAVGFHPNATNISQEQIVEVKKQAQSSMVCAIGEIGLDYYRLRNSKDDQIFVLKEMLDLARQLHVPVCLHNRDADRDLIEILEKWFTDLLNGNHPLVKRPGVFHAFSGSTLIAEWALEHHFFLGINGMITYEKAVNLREEVEGIDLEHFVLETDAPFLSPHPFRGKRNEPKNIPLIARKIAEIKNIGESEVIERTCKNASKLFRWEK